MAATRAVGGAPKCGLLPWVGVVDGEGAVEAGKTVNGGDDGVNRRDARRRGETDFGDRGSGRRRRQAVRVRESEAVAMVAV